MPTFADRVADDLLAESNALGARWQAQARAVAPRVGGRGATPAGGVSAVRGELLAVAAAENAAEIVGALACALRNTPRCQDGVLRAGWSYGVAMHRGAASLHHIVKELDLLAAMALYVVERAAESSGGEGVGAAEGVRVTRRMHGAFTTLRMAASKGYTYAAAEELRDRYRSLRHDLRNPIGTIRSAVSLMEDENLPAEVRFSARYRSMVVRNATSLDAMIGAGLSDSATEVATLAVQEVSLRDVALAVRRDMRDEAESAGCAIEVSPSLGAPALPNVLTDAAAFELALRSIVSIALSRARRGATVTIGLRRRAEGSAVVGVSCEEAEPSAGRPGGASAGVGADALSFAETLLGRVGGRAWREGDGTVLLEIRIAQPASDAAAVERTGEREVHAAVSRVADDLPGGGAPPRPLVQPSVHAGDDLAGARQGDHL